MAGPYDYSINIPQPPAQNFLQSLTGIMQLRQMQEQSALQQQQAAIAQQNAAFQQQMQPLQLEAERARIGQIGQATATSAEALRQGRLTFEQAQAERSLKTKYQNDVLELSKNPEAWTPEKLKSLSMQASVLDPQSFAAMNRMFAELPRVGSTLSNAASEVMLSVQAGKPEIASASLDKYISAANASLESNPNDKSAQASLAFLQSAKTTLDQDPAAAALSASNFLFNTDPQKWDAVSKAMKGAGELAETEAKTKKELVLATATKQEKQVDEEKRTLELEKMRLQNRELEQKLQPGAAPISDTQQKDINALTTEAVDARINVAGATDAINDLLDFAETNPKEFSSGDAASINKFFLNRFGNTTKAQSLRAAVQPFVTKEWISKAAGLKGALSEKEGARLEKGAPKVETAGPEELLNWLRIIQKVELVDADKKDLNAAWQQNARSLQAKAPVEFEVAGVKVKPGDSFQQTLTKVQAGYRKKNQEDIQADAARLKRIQEAGKVGKSPAFGRFDVMGGAPQQPRPASAPKPKLISIEQ
jgi:hypothetical protein